MGLLDLDSLLDSNLDSVEDLPDFQNPPTGAYTLSIPKAEIEDFKTKDGEASRRFRVTFKVEATRELTDKKAVPVADGTMFSLTYQATEDGLKYFKRDAKKFLNADISGVTLRDLLSTLTEVQGMDALVTTKEKDGFENVRVRPVWADEEDDSEAA